MHFCKWTSLVLFVGSTVSVFAQSNTSNVENLVKLDSVSGTVYNATTKTTVPGVRIKTSEAMYTAMTDENGNFTVKFPSHIKTIEVSADGFNNKEVALFSVNKKKDIYLYPSNYETYFRNNLTATGMKRNSQIVIAQSSFDVNNKASISLDAELKNKLSADLRMTSFSGSPAAGSSMLIRGINSLNANTQPLIIVDGIILENTDDRLSIHEGYVMNALSAIDVNDIKSVSVLKDGTTLYGSKGGNGVILIKTNRGEGVATKITASAIVGYNVKPDTQPMMNSSQYRTYLSGLLVDEQARKKLTDQFFLSDDPNFVYYKKYHNNTKWSDGVYHNSATQSYNIGVNGGDDIALYNLSVGITNAMSTLKNNDYSRLNARFNSDINLTDNFNTTFDISYIQTSRELRNDGIPEVITSQINSPGYLSLIKSPFLNPQQFDNAGDLTDKLENYDFLQIANPNAVLLYGVGETQKNIFNLALEPTYDINKNLKVSTMFSYSLNNLSEIAFSPMYGVAPYFNMLEGFSSQNYVKTQFSKQKSLFSDTRVNWNKQKGINSYDLNAGVRYINSSFESEYAVGHNTGSDQAKEMSNSLSFKTVGGVDDPTKSLSYYAVFNYGLLDRYFAEAAVNTETNSKFGKQANSGFQALGVSWAVFPSLNAAWLLSSEEMMKSADFIDVMKLRAGIGQSGNDGIQNIATYTYMNAVKYSRTVTGLQIYNISNPEVQWETVTKRNIGLDVNMFKEKLLLTVDVYNNTTNNLLVLKSLDPIAGLDNYWSNDGKLQNNGYEISLNAKIVSLKNLKITAGASVAHYANKILALADGNYTTSVYDAEILTAVGQPIGQFYGYQTNGVYSTTEEAQSEGLGIQRPNGSVIPFEAGDVRFVNNDNTNNIIDENDKVVIGNSNPDLYGSFNAGIKYKNLNLQMIFNYSYGNDVYNYLRSQIESGSSFNNQSMAVNNRWQTEGQVTSIPKSVYGDPKGNNRFSDRWIEDGSFLRLKTVELSYDLPLKVSFIQGITVWASANNIWTLTKYLGVDPEFSLNNQILYQGIDNGLLPQNQSYFAGIKINL